MHKFYRLRRTLVQWEQARDIAWAWVEDGVDFVGGKTEATEGRG